MIVKVDLEGGIRPVSAARCTGLEGQEARSVEEAIQVLNLLPTHLKYRLYGQGNARNLSLFGMLRHQDDFVHVVVDCATIAEACILACDLLIQRGGSSAAMGRPTKRPLTTSRSTL